MRKEIFTDKNGKELIVTHRKSAVFFEGLADVNKENSYGKRHEEFIPIEELRKTFNFTKEEFSRFISYFEQIAGESWKSFTPKEADSMRAEYDDYYDRDFDNNGRLSIERMKLRIEGPYTQLRSSGEVVRLIKFNKRTFESFVYDLAQFNEFAC